MNEPEQTPVDLDFVEDPSASEQDRADDADLARLLRGRVLTLEAPPSRVDVAAITGGAAPGARPAGCWGGGRRRVVWVVVGAAAAAAAVFAAVVIGGRHLGPTEPAERRGAVATEDGGGTAAVPLRAGVPELPAEEVTRLEALQDRMPLAPPTYFAEPFSTWTTPVECTTNEPVVGPDVAPAVLDGLETSGLRQVCATAAGIAGFNGDNSADDVKFLYRFYLPAGVDLDDVGLGNAPDHGVSWTVIDLDESAQAIQPGDWPSESGGGVTTVRWQDAFASVHRWGPGRTDLTWVEPHGWSDASGAHPVTVRATVAADPVLAVRAAVGFLNQGGIRVVRGDDGSLLLVPDSDPRGEMQALGGGRLTRTPEGCLVLGHGDGGFQLVLWPYGTMWDAGEQVLRVPADHDERIDYSLGDDVVLGGGEGDSQYANALVPAGCTSGKVWVSGGAVHSVDFQAEAPPSASSDEVGPFGATSQQLTAVSLAEGSYAVVSPHVPDAGGLRGSGGAKITGDVGILAGGCFGIVPETPVVWPEGTIALPDGSGVQLPGGAVVRVGDQLDAGGSFGAVTFTGRAAGCPGAHVAFVSATSLR
ncbi:hypothetical protein SAMN06264364_105163 [Quadrisphaera granulorum]|uniref:Uncharacterized protein n=1 Tax=Quadrisphaera granulorum TaxID=317664 RepID=A0A316ADK2_9ACTN|nr:hypothetical protein [Quadrisphaera granulorum]PWJ54954.1 hypothetical protein BXY45_105163 [Quadrisphaera granulorum]SZE95900.1 hypothetical protein SAMN06264364_105163 [Quadrisphaera granulorum]